MSQSSDPPIRQTSKTVVLTYLSLAVLQGAYTLLSILRIPTESNRVILFGLSGTRLVLFLFILTFTVLPAVLFVRVLVRKTWDRSMESRFVARLSDPSVSASILTVAGIVVIWGLNFLQQRKDITEPVATAYYHRLQPVVLWTLLIAAQTFIAIVLLHSRFDRPTIKRGVRQLYVYLLTFGFLLIVTIWIAGTGYGLKSMDVGIGWHPLGTPILFSQLLAVWAMVIAFLVLWVRKKPLPISKTWKRILHLDTLICLTLWLIAFFAWMGQPLKANWFASEPRPPNEQFYPSSDASVYDITAINVSLGAGFMTRGSPFTLRPLYSAFLAALHQLAGLDYESIIWLQVIVLALIPVFLYLLAKRFHHRASALLASLLLIFRELNALRLGDSISDAHVKLLLPFLPTTLGILLFLWLFVRWLQNPKVNSATILIAGSTVGFFMLIRPEIAIFLPFMAIAALLQLRKCTRFWLKGVALLSLGMGLALAPWIGRNYALTGTIFIDSPHYRMDLLNKRYRQEPVGFSLPETAPVAKQPQDTLAAPTIQPMQPNITPDPESPTSIPPSLPQSGSLESPSEEPPEMPDPSQELGITESTGGFIAGIIRFIQQNPVMTLDFITNHFMNSVVQTVLALPITYPITYSTVKYLGHKSPANFWLDCCSLVDYERRLPFWPKWDGLLPAGTLVPLSVTLLLIAVGLAACWRRGKFVGLIPLLAAISYYFVNALVRNSGGRYIIPVNWVGLFYFSIGLIHLTLHGFPFLRPKDYQSAAVQDRDSNFPKAIHSSRFRLALIALGIFIIGAILPLLEILIPQKFDQSTIVSRFNQVFQPEKTPIPLADADYLHQFMAGGGQVYQGLALYPRFHKPYQMGSVWRIYYDRPYEHLDLYLSSPADTGVVLPIADSPVSFPHATEVIVFGCPGEEDIQALSIVTFTQDGEILDIFWRSPSPAVPACPLPLPD